MSISEITSASSIQTDYMKLLIAQLQNQNPLEPLNNNEMASQLAQFSQLQQLESMNSNFAQVLDTAKRSYANSLIGKEVSFDRQTDSGGVSVTSGTVEQISDDTDGQVLLSTGSYTFHLQDIVSVKN
jgi:flagellar basal-body rod modification protein FlgD